MKAIKFASPLLLSNFIILLAACTKSKNDLFIPNKSNINNIVNAKTNLSPYFGVGKKLKVLGVIAYDLPAYSLTGEKFSDYAQFVLLDTTTFTKIYISDLAFIGASSFTAAPIAIWNMSTDSVNIYSNKGYNFYLESDDKTMANENFSIADMPWTPAGTEIVFIDKPVSTPKGLFNIKIAIVVKLAS